MLLVVCVKIWASAPPLTLSCQSEIRTAGSSCPNQGRQFLEEPWSPRLVCLTTTSCWCRTFEPWPFQMLFSKVLYFDTTLVVCYTCARGLHCWGCSPRSPPAQLGRWAHQRWGTWVGQASQILPLDFHTWQLFLLNKKNIMNLTRMMPHSWTCGCMLVVVAISEYFAPLPCVQYLFPHKIGISQLTCPNASYIQLSS